MEILSTADVFLIKCLAAGTAGYISRSYLKRWQTPNVEPLIPRRSTNNEQTAHASLPQTRSIRRSLEQSQKQCMIFFGSQTGTAEKLALNLSKEAKTRFGMQCIVADLDDYDYDDLLHLSDKFTVVFVLATYGEGEPTDNTVTFNRFMEERPKQHCASTLHYAAFGLGNSSYQYYNEMIKRVDGALSGCGASRIGVLGLGDDGKGSLEDDFLNWRDSVLPMLASHLSLEKTQRAYEPTFRVERTKMRPTVDTFLGEPNKSHLRGKLRGPYTLSNPYPAPLGSARSLFPTGPREFLHIEFDLGESTLGYETGDHLVIRPMNSDWEVDRFLRVFGLADEQHETIRIVSNDTTVKVPVPEQTTFDAVARYYIDICAPVSRQLLSILARHAPTETAKTKLQSLDDPPTFRQQVIGRCLNLAQVLEWCDTTPWTVDFSLLLENMPIMKPRYYSISSSPRSSKRIPSITAVVESRNRGIWQEKFKGVATNYLRALAMPESGQGYQTHQVAGPRQRYQHPTCLVSVRRSNFKPPRDSRTPIIMIGPGTGVAPFRGFIHDRIQSCREGKEVGRTMLFYGCRRKDEDFLYQDEWAVSILPGSTRDSTNVLQDAMKIMTPEVFSLHVAFSREAGQQKTYVQDLFQDHANEIRDLILKQNASVYVCGDAHRMARDVFGRMAHIIAEDESFQDDIRNAEDYLRELKRAGRWLEDVW